MTTTALRVLTTKLVETSSEQLPYLVPSLSDIFINTDFSFLDVANKPTPKQGGPARNASSLAESGVIAEQLALFNKLRAQLTTLVADTSSTPPCWSAVFLIHTYISTRGWAAVEQSAPWVRSLINLLQRPTPSSVRTLAVAALSSIFRLSVGHAQFIRETITPNLPTFVRLNLGILREYVQPKKGPIPSAGLVRAVLSAFLDLLPNHPTIFRPFQKDLDAILSHLAVSPQSAASDVSLQQSATLLLAELGRCAPRTGASDAWNESVSNLIRATHHTLDRLLRSLPFDVELELDPSSESGVEPNNGAEPSDPTSSFGFPPWTGLIAGTYRVTCLLSLLSTFICSSTPLPVTIPLGSINSLLSRILDLHPLSAAEIKSLQFDRVVDPSIPRTEQLEIMTLHLTSLHTASLQVGTHLATIVGHAASPVLIHLLRLLPSHLSRRQQSSFGSQPTASPKVRQAIYEFVATVLTLLGSAVSASLTFSGFSTAQSTSFLTPVIRFCCTDLLEYYVAAQPKIATAVSNPSAPTAIFATSTPHIPFPSHSLIRAASALLPTLYIIPASTLPASIRALLDRTTVLLQHETAFIASSLYPSLPSSSSVSSGGLGVPKSASTNPSLSASSTSATVSILSMAPRQPGGGYSLQIEGLVHPRFPAIKASIQGSILNPEVDMTALGSDRESSDSFEGISHKRTSRPEDNDVAANGDTLSNEIPSKRARIKTSLRALISDLTSFQNYLECEPVCASVSAGSSNPVALPSTLIQQIASLPDTEVDNLQASSQAPQSTLDADVDMDVFSITISKPKQVQNGLPSIPADKITDKKSLAPEEEDDDDDFEIPTLVMESDSASDAE